MNTPAPLHVLTIGRLPLMETPNGWIMYWARDQDSTRRSQIRRRQFSHPAWRRLWTPKEFKGGVGLLAPDPLKCAHGATRRKGDSQHGAENTCWCCCARDTQWGGKTVEEIEEGSDHWWNILIWYSIRYLNLATWCDIVILYLMRYTNLIFDQMW